MVSVFSFAEVSDALGFGDLSAALSPGLFADDSMPVEASLIAAGTRPHQSPRSTDINGPWTMRFAAGLGETAPQFLDNRVPLLAHPCFLQGALENPCMFLSVYAVGVTNKEASAVVHASIDSLLPAPFHPGGSALATEFGVVSAAARRAGVELVTEISHCVGDETVCRSRWGCVILGQRLADEEIDALGDAPDWPALPVSGPTADSSASEATLEIAPTAAHIWESCIQARFLYRFFLNFSFVCTNSCIQDPTHGRRLGSMISPHTDAAVAEKAGFPARTLTGVCLLGMAVSQLSKSYGFDLASVCRVAATFAAPVYIDTEQVELSLRFWAAPGEGGALFFEVLQPAEGEDAEGKSAIRGGYISWEDAGSVSKL